MRQKMQFIEFLLSCATTAVGGKLRGGYRVLRVQNGLGKSALYVLSSSERIVSHSCIPD